MSSPHGDPQDDPAADTLIGRTIAGKYTLQSKVGSGAMGTVYRARQVALEKTVAIKILNRELETSHRYVERFEVEAKAASKLDHPNSTRVIDFGREDDGLLYIAMEFVEGRSLHDVMPEWPLRDARMASILSQALAAIAVAHEQGILHRDLKPENILLVHGTDDEGRHQEIVKVCDFGIAKVFTAGARDRRSIVDGSEMPGVPGRLTQAGVILGTPAYMSPEQAAGDPLDARSDLYSLGVILYELLTDRLPFEHADPGILAQMHMTGVLKPPQELRPKVNPALARICMKAMGREPAERYASAREMRAELKELLPENLPEKTSSVRPGAPVARGGGGSRGWRVAPLLVLIGGLAGLAGSLRPRASVAPPPVTAAATAPDIPVASPPPVSPATTDPVVPEPIVPVSTGRVASRGARGRSPSPIPSPTPVAVAPDPPAVTPTPAQTPTPAPLPAPAPPPAVDLKNARVAVDSINVVRVTTRDVTNALARVDLRGCYVAALKSGASPSPASVLVTLKIDDLRVVSATMTPAGASPVLRRCVESQLLGGRMPSADTGTASAQIALTLSGT